MGLWFPFASFAAVQKVTKFSVMQVVFCPSYSVSSEVDFGYHLSNMNFFLQQGRDSQKGLHYLSLV